MDFSEQELKTAYRTMRHMRNFDEIGRREFMAGTLPGFMHMYCGEEAIGAGVCAHLSDEDYIASTHRGHGHCIAKGCAIEDMALEIFCRQDGLCHGKGGSMHIADLKKGMLGANAIVGGSAPLAVGAALTAKTRGTDKVSIAFIGDGASNQGTVFEAMNLAVVLKLPAIFVYENNGYAEMTGVDYHCGSGDIAARAGAFGMPAHKVDGTDYFAVYEAMAEATQHARSGKGPVSIECIAPRWYGHFEGDPQSYRTKEEIADLEKNRDPILLFRDRVIAETGLTQSDFDAIDAESLEHVEKAMAAAKAAPQPEPADLLTDVYEVYD
ncbi:acetoin:2,6-dichlorophenolindophenol oxidoreductase alpha subunit [Luminiphilus syltensis NOR5-1B]|uniref:Acetoin:2,6-dichlorophenolindophenol oxidoreductase alpha subunit n=1 Tax=Luminiphilus syltensis NOR5-1B TaxID=565045 RepID=B8KTZ0_9GAMM|nr:thiamine pyrophosphate-dependent dehydrogenase E1 component subunit alpha [Luminiphilus syltensis]EED35829.1 acetoin:2,6-dichlorophenolindophenol oxidoreductase alpha subunit [Luminiphilus syltensis NOR5-1B]